ncbi:hypothetical protein GCM10009678_45070 [Actinomadura kijaniata]|uniref:Uncharacterized protein n=1 Tax=Actinomadura namibiensis TaxID=182080 RepID=A0A7W3LWS8_ACTNM|nr:hypothetical protein [Actinomadura namibiensis]MBA8955744.1 hypothetical protein [Actinomadura namibiensis]
MKNEARPNPFHVLGLSPDADRDTVVARGRELSDLADTEERRALCGWAVRELLGSPGTRRVHELLEVPGAAYRDEEWEDFARRHRRRPANTKALKRAAEELRTADFDLAAILGLVLDGLLEPPPVDLAEGVRAAPVPPGPGDPPLEVTDVLFG